MKRICTGCYHFFTERKTGSIFLCHRCDTILKSLEKFQEVEINQNKDINLRVSALYDYQSLMRELILRAKVKSELRALECLCNLCLSHPVVWHLAGWADAIVAAPSSMWGRVRGRFDIAGYFAWQLTTQQKKPIINLPSRFYWQFRKRALKNHRRGDVGTTTARLGDRLQDLWLKLFWEQPPAPQKLPERILIVDDIVTTGFTLARVAHNLKGKDLRLLVLANAYNEIR